MTVALQRARGRAACGFVLRDGRTRLARLAQAGAAKLLLPRGGAMPEAVFVNTAGGLAAGDVLDHAVDLGPGARAVATTQAAERVYRGDVPARVHLRVRLDAGARLAWLPQETILFDGASLARVTEVDMAADAEIVLLDTLILGRGAMGETVRRLDLTDRRVVRRDGVPILLEPVRLCLPGGGGGPATLRGARVVATLTLLAPDAADRLGSVRRALAQSPGVRAAASAWDGRLTLRAAAADAWPLRQTILAAIHALGRGPAPRTWPS